MLHISADEFSRVVGCIYDCALDPSLWRPTIAELGRVMDFRWASLILATTPARPDDAPPRTLIDISTGISSEERKAMLTHGQDPIDAWGPPGTLESLPLETPILRSVVNPAAAETRYVRDRCLPLGYFDNLSVMFLREPTCFSVFSLNRHLDEGPIGDPEVELCRLLIPHLKRALTISRVIEARTVTFGAVLDGLACAVLLVTADLRLIHANRAGEALLRGRDPIGLSGGRLVAPSGLAAALRAALAVPRDEIARRGLGIPARRRDGGELVLHLLPLTEAGPLSGAAAAIFVMPAVDARPPPAAAVATLFDLTPTEARVLELICQGRTNSEVAAALDIALATARSHLARIFAKTGTHRQTDLVTLVSSFSLPLG